MVSSSGLEQSILASGPLLPVYFIDGLIIDGEKRQGVCHANGIEIEETHFLCPEDAAPVLFRLHPDRCARLFPCDSISEAAELYKASLGEVSHLYKAPPPIKRDPEYWRRFDAARVALKSVTVRMAPALWNDAKRVAKAHGVPSSLFLRIALAYAVENWPDLQEFSRLHGAGLRYNKGPKGPTGPKVQRREPRPPRGPKWSTQS